MPEKRKTTPQRKGAVKPAARGGSKSAAKRPTPARRPANTKKQPVKGKNNSQQKQNPGDTAMMLYFCAFVLTAIFVLIDLSGNTNGFTGGVNDILHGLFGSLTPMIPVVFLWMGVRRFRGPEKQGQRGTDELPPLALTLAVLTSVEAFNADRISAGTQVDGYINFLRFAYRDGKGGGLIGAFAGYWGSMITAWLTLILCLMFLAILFNSRGYFSVREIGNRVSDGTRKVKEKAAAIKTSIEEKRELYSEDKHVASWEKPDNDVDIPDFDRKIDMKMDELRSAGRQMHIDRAKEPVKKPEPYRGEASSARRETTPSRTENTASRREGGSVYTERVRTPETAKPAPSAKPVPSAKPAAQPRPAFNEAPAKAPVKAPARKEPEYDEPDILEDDYEIPDFLEPVKAEKPHREPQQPRPSFFDEKDPEPVIKQKSDQGRSVKEAREDFKLTDTVEKLDSSNAAVHREYRFPDLELLESGAHEGGNDNSVQDRQRGQMLVQILGDFNIPVKLVGISHGPAVTRLEILPEPGIKVSRISQYSDDIQMGLEVKSVRIEAPIPGRRAVGIEIPNPKREIVNLRDVLESQEARTSKKKLLVALGKDNGGNYICADLAGMPHVLIAGQTGSGKSICINAIIISLLYRYTPDEVRLIMVDPKMVELNVYNTIPHLLVPVVTDPQKAAGALDWAVMEMTRRYKVFKDNGTKNIENYNAHLPEGEKPMPRIVIIVDELADLMMTAKHDVEESINRLAQLARAAGMHLVIATQRPSVNVITGLIKANIPTRIAFTVASGVDSNTILDSYGAEKLLGKGDMLYAAADTNKPMRMQGAWISEDEVQRVVDHISSQESAVFDEAILDHLEAAASSDADKRDKQEREANEDTDPLLEDALRTVVEAGQASTSMLQRRLKVGYPRAGKLIDMMEQRGYIAKGEGSKARDVIITREQMERLFNGDDTDET